LRNATEASFGKVLSDEQTECLPAPEQNHLAKNKKAASHCDISINPIFLESDSPQAVQIQVPPKARLESLTLRSQQLAALNIHAESRRVRLPRSLHLKQSLILLSQQKFKFLL
jgi:hypothetical protein